MGYPTDMDAEMRELLDALGTVVVPEAERKAAYRTNLHAPYYSRGRYKRI